MIDKPPTDPVPPPGQNPAGAEPVSVPGQATAGTHQSSAVDLRNKYAEQMAHPSAQPPAMKIAIIAVTVSVLLMALAVFVATGGPAKLMGKPTGRAAIEITVPARA